MKRIVIAIAALGLVISSAQADETQSTNNTTVIQDSTPANPDADSVRTTEINRTQVTTPQNQQPGVADPAMTVDRTQIREEEVTASDFRNEAFGTKLQLGLTDVDSSRAAIGITFDTNFLRRVNTEGGKPYLGLSLGAIYSHLGNPGGDFLGLNGAGGDNGTHLLQLPLNLKVGYTFSDVFRPSIHGGMNVIFLSERDTQWDTNTNIGADLEFGIGKGVSFLIRPDWTFLDNDDTLFTGTIGFGFPVS